MRIRNFLIGVAIVGTCIAGFWGCNRENVSQSASYLAPHSTEGGQTQPRLGTTISLSSNEETRSNIVSISNRTTVSQLMDKYEAAGFVLDIPNSFVEEGDIAVRDSLDIHWSKRTILAMRFAQDTMRMAVYLVHVESDFPSFVLPMTVAFGAAPDTGSFAEAGQGVWIMGHDAVPELEYSHGVVPSATDGTSWFGCWLGGTLGGCATSAVGCLVGGPGYAACVAAWCGGSAIGSAICCAIVSLFG